jgi:hypothetical protein
MAGCTLGTIESGWNMTNRKLEKKTGDREAVEKALKQRLEIATAPWGLAIII